MSDEHLMGAKGAGLGPACLDNPLIDIVNEVFKGGTFDLKFKLGEL